MKTLRLGEFTIERVLDMEGPTFEPKFLLPGLSPETLAANRGWLEPRFIEPASGKLVLSYHSFVVRTPRHTILIDTCIGNDKERGHAFFNRRQGPYLQNLAALGLAPEDVDIVCCTHLHVDHVGWNTRLVDGRWVPTFPNAKYLFARDEYSHWEAKKKAAPHALLNHGAYEDSVLPVVAAGQAVLVAADHAVEDGIVLEPMPGHTPGCVAINFASGGERAVCAGDAIIHALQVADPSLSSSYCEDPEMSRVTRRRLIERIADTPTRLLPAHFPDPVVGRVARAGNGFRFVA